MQSTCTRTCACTHTHNNSCAHTYACTFTHSHTFIHTSACTHICAHIHSHTRTYIHTWLRHEDMCFGVELRPSLSVSRSTEQLGTGAQASALSVLRKMGPFLLSPSKSEVLVAGQLHVLVTSASYTGPHGQRRALCLGSYPDVTILKPSLIFTPEALHFSFLHWVPQIT